MPVNFGVIFCGFIDMFIGGTDWVPSGFSAPASIRQNVLCISAIEKLILLSAISYVLPVPFSPIMTTISESVNSPASTARWKPPKVFSIFG